MGIFGGSGVEEAAAAVASAEASTVAEAGLGFDMLGKVSKDPRSPLPPPPPLGEDPEERIKECMEDFGRRCSIDLRRI